MTNFLLTILKLFILALVLIAVGYFFGMAFAIIPGINTLLTGVPFLTVEMLPTIFAWLTMVGIIGALIIVGALKAVEVGE